MLPLVSAALPRIPLCEKIQKARENHKKLWLIYGLSANPIHLGHINFLEKVSAALKPDRVILIPTKYNPEKNPYDQCPPDIKSALIKTALAHHTHWEVDEQELKREGPSLTWMTVRQLAREANGNAILGMLYTNESVENFHTWDLPSPHLMLESAEEKEARQNYIINRATLIIGERPNLRAFDRELFLNRLRRINELSQQAFKGNAEIALQNSKGELVTLKLPERTIKPITPQLMQAFEEGFLPVRGDLDISSTQIRSLCSQGLPLNQLIHHLTPLVGPAVAHHITTLKLFQK